MSPRVTAAEAARDTTAALPDHHTGSRFLVLHHQGQSPFHAADLLHRDRLPTAVGVQLSAGRPADPATAATAARQGFTDTNLMTRFWRATPLAVHPAGILAMRPAPADSPEASLASY